ncbi:MliC family protein [Simiduia agarivorans]|uniref:C-type lysozyme inhibitor domain-containing protein n=1 Tax=Simiduia agarivorans (strain DSM 21679 / JCM 13881 / BCRC 17597 / SA1) TaxID=1117647 RepID=K4KPS7_SIMAS|nr:MliC family protein [Simiduia agarivorans]AFV00246.1 hypothetical protein M5M_15565 [Simiduia agarivorans SA1 = DSM 21679]
MRWIWLCLCGALFACNDPASSGFASLHGELTGADEVPTGSRATVIIEEVGPADRAALRVAEISQAATPSPQQFELSYQPVQLANGHRYNARARIEDAKGQLLWTTDQAYPITDNTQFLSLTLRAVKATTPARKALFDCAGESLEVTFNNTGARVAFRGAQWSLEHQPSASGAHYRGDGMDFWTKGDEAILRLDDSELRCQRPRA